MKKFLQSITAFAPQTVDAINSVVQYSIRTGQYAELQTETLNVQVSHVQDEEKDTINITVMDSTEEYHNTLMCATYNYEGTFFTSVGMQTTPKPEPKLLPLAGLLGLVLSNSQQKG